MVFFVYHRGWGLFGTRAPSSGAVVAAKTAALFNLEGIGENNQIIRLKMLFKV
jgi:hypothetical protein